MRRKTVKMFVKKSQKTPRKILIDVVAEQGAQATSMSLRNKVLKLRRCRRGTRRSSCFDVAAEQALKLRRCRHGTSCSSRFDFVVERATQSRNTILRGAQGLQEGSGKILVAIYTVIAPR
jgi:hypothetical protein